MGKHQKLNVTVQSKKMFVPGCTEQEFLFHMDVQGNGNMSGSVVTAKGKQKVCFRGNVLSWWVNKEI